MSSRKERLTKERRLAALAEAVGAYEAQFAAISVQELGEQKRADRAGTVIVGGKKPSRPNRQSRRTPRDARSR